MKAKLIRCQLSHFLLLALLVCASFLAVHAQQQPAVKSPESGGDDPRLKVNGPESKRQNIVRVKAFAERIIAYNDIGIRTLTLSRLADLLWIHEEPYARELFVRALDFSSSKDDVTLKNSKLTVRGLARIHRQVIGYIAKRDPTWAKRLIDSENAGSEKTAYSQSQQNVETAYDLALSDQASTSSEFAERSLRGGVSPWIVGVLIELRRSDEKLANSLFLKVVDQVAAEPSLDPDTLLYLGTYIFTSPRVDPENHTAVAQISVGGVLIYDITADRPGVPPLLIQRYLGAASRVICRPDIRRDQVTLYYVTAYLLLAKAQRFAPDLVPVINGAMQTLATGVSPELRDGKAYKGLQPEASAGLDEQLKEIEKIAGQDLRDERYLGLAGTLWHKKDYSAASLVTARISDQELKGQLDSLIGFGEATLAIRQQDLNAAAKIAAKMPQTIERAILWLAIGHSHAKAKRPETAVDNLNSAIRDARKLEDGRRAFLILSAASEMVNLDSNIATGLIEEAIKIFNAQEADSMKDVVWARKLEKGRTLRLFPIEVAGIKFGYHSAFLEFSKIEPQAAIAAAGGLSSENASAQSLLAVATTLLSQ